MSTQHIDAFSTIDRHFFVEFARAGKSLREAQRLRHQVFRTERQILPIRRDTTIEADEYDQHSRHIVLRNRDDGQVVGTARLVAAQSGAAPRTLPMLHYCDAALLGHLPLQTTGEISRFALSKRRRPVGTPPDRLLRLALMRGILHASLDLGLTHWCALMEPTLLRLMRCSGVNFTPLGPLVEAYGLRQPAAVEIDFTLAEGRDRHPDLYRFVAGAPDLAVRPGVEGPGMEGPGMEEGAAHLPAVPHADALTPRCSMR
jgi:N-acyl-L-homoserine lactone synthetase